MELLRDNCVLHTEITFPIRQFARVYDVNRYGQGSVIPAAPRIFWLLERRLTARTSRYGLQIFAPHPLALDFRIVIMNYAIAEADRRIIGELLFSAETYEYIAVPRTEVRPGIGDEYIVDTIMILGFQFDRDVQLSVKIRTGPRSSMSQQITLQQHGLVPQNYTLGHGVVSAQAYHPVLMAPNDWYARQRRLSRFAQRVRSRSPLTTRPSSRPSPSRSPTLVQSSSSPISWSSMSVQSSSPSPISWSPISVQSSPSPISWSSMSMHSLPPPSLPTPTHESIAPIEVGSVSVAPTPAVKKESGESVGVQFHVSSEVIVISSDSDEPEAGPSHAMPPSSEWHSARPRNPTPHAVPEPTVSRRLPRSLRRRNIQDIRQRRLSGYNSSYEARELGVVEAAYQDHEIENIDPDYHGWCHICAAKMVDYRWPCGHLTCTECARRCHASFNYEGLECYQCRQWYVLLNSEHPMHGNFSRYINVSRFERRHSVASNDVNVLE